MQPRQQAQASLEFALILGVAATVFFLLLPLIGELFSQKSNDIQARAKAYYAFANGNGNSLNADAVFVPDIDIDAALPRLDGFDFGNVALPFLGGLGFALVAPNLMDFMQFGTPDSILGNAFYQSGVSYFSSGLDADAAQRGAMIGGLSSAQFGRLTDSIANDLTGGNFVDFADASLQENWGATFIDGAWGGNISFAADALGNVAQGALVGYYSSDGDWKAAAISGVNSGVQTGAVQSYMRDYFGGNEVKLGAFNGAVDGSLQVLGGADNALLTVGTATASGAFMSNPIQDRIFGRENSGDKTGFSRGFLGSGLNGAFAGSMQYVRSGSSDSTPILIGAAFAAASYTVSYADEASGFQGWRQEQQKKIQDAGKAVADKTGLTAAQDKVKEVQNNISDGLSNMGNQITGNADANNPENASGESATVPKPTDVEDAVKATHASGELLGYSVAVGMLAAATFAVTDSQTGQKSKNQSSQNNPTAPTAAVVNDSIPASPQTQDGLLTKSSTQLPPNTSAPSLQERRMPQDVNVRQLAKSPLAQELKSHRNQAVAVVKSLVSRRLQATTSNSTTATTNTHRPTTTTAVNGKPLSPAIAKTMADPKVEAAVEAIVDQILSDEQMSRMLAKAQDDLTQLNAIATQMAMRAVERSKSSRRHIYQSAEEKSLKQKLLERLVELSSRLGASI